MTRWSMVSSFRSGAGRASRRALSRRSWSCFLSDSLELRRPGCSCWLGPARSTAPSPCLTLHGVHHGDVEADAAAVDPVGQEHVLLPRPPQEDDMSPGGTARPIVPTLLLLLLPLALVDKLEMFLTMCWPRLEMFLTMCLTTHLLRCF